MKRFVLRLLGVIPFFLIVGGVNYCIDSKHFLRENSELYVAADKILRGNSIATSERVLQHDFVKRYLEIRGKDDVNVMGSSKCMMIDSSFFPNTSFFNYYVSNSSFVEFLAITSWLEKKDMLPDTLVMELSFSQFHNMYGGQPACYFKECEEFCERLSIAPPEMEGKPDLPVVYRLFSMAYFVQNLRFEKTERYFETDDPWLKNHYVLHPDGSLWVGQYLELTGEEKRRRTQDAMADKLNHVTRLDDRVKVGFTTLIGYLQQRGTTVLLYLPPYHPETYQLYVKDNPLFSELRQLASQLQHDHKLEVMGNYDPNTYQLTDADFYDALHISKSGFLKIWKERTNFSGLASSENGVGK